jgi:hypothetical protein
MALRSREAGSYFWLRDRFHERRMGRGFSLIERMLADLCFLSAFIRFIRGNPRSILSPFARRSGGSLTRGNLR